MFRHAAVGIDEQHGKFVAAIARSHVCRAAMFIHDRREPAKRAISRQVAMKVVDAFELVKIEKKQCERMTAAVGAAHFALEAVHEFAVIREPRQAVVARLIERLFLRFLSVSDIHGGAQASADFAGCREQRPRADLQHVAFPRVFATRNGAAQGRVMLGNGGGMSIGGFQELADVPPCKGTGANLGGGQGAAPMRQNSKIPVGRPMEARHLIHQQADGGLLGQPERFVGVERLGHLENSFRFAIVTANNAAPYSQKNPRAVLVEPLSNLDRS